MLSIERIIAPDVDAGAAAIYVTLFGHLDDTSHRAEIETDIHDWLAVGDPEAIELAATDPIPAAIEWAEASEHEWPEIGRGIAQQRKRCDWNQAALAARMGVSREQISRWESGAVLPSVAQWRALGVVLA